SRSAPSRSSSSARAMAACESRYAPPSEKLSGVTLSTPITSVRSPRSSVREGRCRRNCLRWNMVTIIQNHTEEDHTEGGENSLDGNGNPGPGQGILSMYGTMAVQFRLAFLSV